MIEMGGKHMDKVISIIVGFFGTVIAGFFGGWTYAFQVLLILMAIDYLSGLVVAGVFKKSTKLLGFTSFSYSSSIFPDITRPWINSLIEA